MSVNPATSKPTKRRVANLGAKEEIIKTKLGAFFKSFIKEEPNLKKCFDTSRLKYLGSGVFGHVFSLKASKDLTFGDLDSLTKAMMKDENHSTHNRIVGLKISNPGEIAIRKNVEVAMKCENAFDVSPEDFPITHQTQLTIDDTRYLLYKEYNALCQIFNRYGYSNVRGFTKPYAFGRLGDFHEVDTGDMHKAKMFAFHFILFEMCGPDMEELMNACSYDCKQMDQKMSSRTVLLVGDQLLARLQSIHEPQLGFMHNDLKGDQLMVGRYSNANTIYLIDYGLVSRYTENWGKDEMEPAGNKRWAPRSHHLRKPGTPLCEIESACYVLLRLLRNQFPWDGLFDKFNQIMNDHKNRGEDLEGVRTPDSVVYDVKHAMWLHLRATDPNKLSGVKDINNNDIDFKTFFEDRDDKWDDGGSQVMEVMLEMGKLCGNKDFMFWENRVAYENISYMDLRKHLLSIFDLSMYSHNLDATGLSDGQKMKLAKIFEENKAINDARTNSGRPVYYYFPPGEQNCYWEWYCKAINMSSDQPAYWHKLLSNREQLLENLKAKKKGKADKQKGKK